MAEELLEIPLMSFEPVEPPAALRLVEPPASLAEPVIYGSVTPRLWTPPLIQGPPGPCGCGCALTPETSYGFELVDLANNVLEQPFFPWQRWLAIHIGELLPDGRPRFRKVLVLVARQNGKTHFARVLTLYWMFIEQVPLILATSNKLGYAKEQWEICFQIASTNEHLSKEIPPRAQYRRGGEEYFINSHGSKYQIAAANDNAGRSLTVHRLLMDELCKQTNHDAYSAAYYAMNAVADAQMVAITNQGDDSAVVLDRLRDPAIEFIETGQGNARTGLFEWSSPRGSDPTDIQALALANPGMGWVPDADIPGEAREAKRLGGVVLSKFRTQVMCMRVAQLDPAIDPDAWLACASEDPVDLAEHRDKVVLCLDVSLNGDHAALVAAAVINDLIHTEVIESWDGYGCTKTVRAELPAIVARVQPRQFGRFPNGPAAALEAEMQEKRTRGWPPRGVELVAVRGDTVAACMGLAEVVMARDLRHPDDPMLNQHIEAAQKLNRGDGWVFMRRGAGPIDGAYALAGAVDLARRLPPPRPDLEIA